MVVYLLLPFAIHAGAMSVDEFYFHYRRGLPLWERWGHPLDTLTILACYYWILAMPLSTGTIKIYAALAVFSCLFVTKDEWVHARYCRPGEQWLHAVLFLLHPVILLMAAVIWPFLHEQNSAWVVLDEAQRRALKTAFFVLLGISTSYLFYQIIYWSWIWKGPRNLPPSTMPGTTS